MSKQWHGGKGDGVRKYDAIRYNDGWSRIFGKKCVICGNKIDVNCGWSSCKQANVIEDLNNGKKRTNQQT
jgi:hypothetical protein